MTTPPVPSPAASPGPNGSHTSHAIRATINKAIQEEGERIATAVFEGCRDIIECSDSDGIETEDPAEHIVRWIQGVQNRATERKESPAASPRCIGCAETILVGYTMERKPGPFCRACWDALKQHVADLAPAASPGVDPWEKVHRLHAGEWLTLEERQIYFADEVDAARAAERQQAEKDRTHYGNLRFLDGFNQARGHMEAEVASLTQHLTEARQQLAAAIDAFEKHTRALHHQRTTPDNLAALIDAVCETQHRTDRELFEARQENERLKVGRGIASLLTHEIRADEPSKLEEAEQARAALQQQIETLRQALRNADEGIQRGQACRSEAEFTRWMHDVQANRPTAAHLTGDPHD